MDSQKGRLLFNIDLFVSVLILSSLQVQEIITLLADRQTEILVAQKKWKQNDKRIEKQRKALRKELEVVAKAITEKAVATVDSLRTLRYSNCLSKEVDYSDTGMIDSLPL